MAKVDILLPFWGDVDLFKRTVLSVLAQTEDDWKLSIYDDHYPSLDAATFIESLRDPRISYHRHEQNIGITPNFNYALDRVAANFFVMVGCDDVFLPNYLEVALKEIDAADFYQPGVEIINGNGDVYAPLTDRVKDILRPQAGIYSGEKLASSLCKGNWLYFPSILWRSEVVKKYGFDNKYKIAEDLNLILQLILDDHKLKISSTKTFQYRRFAQSLSSKEKKRGGIRFEEEIEVYEKFSQLFKNRGWRKAALLAKLRITSRINQLLG
jgi:glycosyltransferase involved in cell wall biosynthesis